ncbi:MAG TPA: hypothetical protein VLJ14_14735 [Ktedonobacterales bacterium]|jgi:hypothetical protein|nr:hypothetical protein [Ktedonobacterales bacterium]
MRSLQSPRQGIIARYIAGGAVALVVLALVGVVFTLHTAAGAPRAAAVRRVKATTPPDAVHVVVTTETGHALVPDPNATNCPANTTCLTSAAVDTKDTPYDHTFTDAATVQRLQDDLNGPSDPASKLPTCGAAGSPEALLYSASVQTDDFTFTAGGQTVEHVVISLRCGELGVRSGFAPDLTLGAERGWLVNLNDVLTLTYPHMPPPAITQSASVGRPPAQPTPTMAP